MGKTLFYHVKIARNISGNDLNFNLRTFLSKICKERPSRADGSLSSIIFIHHSVGENLCNQGASELPPVRELFKKKGYKFYSHNYNEANTSKPLEFSDGSVRVGYNIPWNNTDPDGLDDLFSQRVNINKHERIWVTPLAGFYHTMILL